VPRYAYKVYYDGTGFYGFQRQPGIRTVEGELIRALMKTRSISSDSSISKFASAGRTDRLASAMGNVFAVNLKKDLAPAEINSELSEDVRVWAEAQVPGSFNPRLALRRHYKYFIHVTEGINVDSLIETSKLFLGVHDFRRFAHGPCEENPTREVTDLTVSRLDDNFLSISIIGDSFLRRMVRKIVGVLVYVASDLLQPADVQRLFDPKSIIPRMGVPSAPAENLILWDVDYGFSFGVDRYAVRKLQSSLAKSLTELAAKKEMLKAFGEFGK
jgi:tRNA pseudouridine38-40 synthase